MEGVKFLNNQEEERKALLNMLVKCGIIEVNYSEINLLHLYKMNLNEILSYIFAHKLQKELTKGPYFEYVYVKGNISFRHSKYKLLVNEKKNTGVFQLKPDIVIAKCGIESIIIDTKWKSISSLYNRHGVKREDLYQMYAYLTRYPNVETVVLLYPYNDRVDNHNECLESWVLEHDRNKKIKVYSVNLENEKSTIKSLKNIIKDININSKVYL